MQWPFFPNPNRKTEHFKALKRNSHSSPIADHTNQTGLRIKIDHFDILATGQSDIRCKIKEILLTRDLKPALNENVGIYIFSSRFNKSVYCQLLFSLSATHDYFPYLVRV